MNCSGIELVRGLPYDSSVWRKFGYAVPLPPVVAPLDDSGTAPTLTLPISWMWEG